MRAAVLLFARYAYARRPRWGGFRFNMTLGWYYMSDNGEVFDADSRIVHKSGIVVDGELSYRVPSFQPGSYLKKTAPYLGYEKEGGKKKTLDRISPSATARTQKHHS